MRDDAFDRSLRRRFQQVLGDRGTCPSQSALSDYLHRRLPDTHHQTITEHLLLCGHCHIAIYRMTQPHRVFRFLRSRWLAYVAAVAALAFAVLRTHPPQAIPARVIVLDALRRAEADSMPAARPLAAALPIVLSFFIPMERQSSYSARVLDGANRTLWGPVALVSQDGLGNCHLFLPRPVPSGGEYRLVVAESGGKEYSFSFRI